MNPSAAFLCDNQLIHDTPGLLFLCNSFIRHRTHSLQIFLFYCNTYWLQINLTFQLQDTGREKGKSVIQRVKDRFFTVQTYRFPFPGDEVDDAAESDDLKVEGLFFNSLLALCFITLFPEYGYYIHAFSNLRQLHKLHKSLFKQLCGKRTISQLG